jgi:hypothetical protein
MVWSVIGNKIFSSLLILGLLGLAVYFGFVRPHTKPNPTESQMAESLTNHTFEPHFGFMGGCASYRISKDK